MNATNLKIEVNPQQFFALYDFGWNVVRGCLNQKSDLCNLVVCDWVQEKLSNNKYQSWYNRSNLKYYKIQIPLSVALSIMKIISKEIDLKVCDIFFRQIASKIYLALNNEGYE
jgi:hypothetical protein